MNAPIAASRPRATPNAAPQITTELVKDPACDTYIEKTSAVFRDGSYFCSESCAAKYTLNEAQVRR